jgi:hypothetical protein
MPTINVTRSIHIDAHPKKIYPSISNLSNWQKWSPWVIAEPNVKIKLTSDGNYYEWEGDIIGAGNLKIFDREVNKSVQMHLSFLKPWKSKATTTFHLKPTPFYWNGL